MIDINVFYQVSLFSNLSEVSATPENTMKLLRIFGDFGLLPTTIHELSNTNHSLATPVLTPSLRPRLQSPNGEWAITFLTQNILVERNFTGESMETLDSFIGRASTMLELFMREFDKKGKRIALITKSFLKQMPDEQLNGIYNKISRPIDFYTDGGVPFEWNLRSVRKMNYTVGGTEEVSNAITNISRVSGQFNQNGMPSDFDRISFDFDINTVPQNEDIRFSYDVIPDFLGQAARTQGVIINELERLIYD